MFRRRFEFNYIVIIALIKIYTDVFNVVNALMNRQIFSPNPNNDIAVGIIIIVIIMSSKNHPVIYLFIFVFRSNRNSMVIKRDFQSNMRPRWSGHLMKTPMMIVENRKDTILTSWPYVINNTFWHWLRGYFAFETVPSLNVLCEPTNGNNYEEIVRKAIFFKRNAGVEIIVHKH